MTTALSKPRKKQNHHDLRTTRRALVLGFLISVLVVLLDVTNSLSPLEHAFYDARLAFFQFFRKPPTDRLVHIDIDDGALETIARWPWHRSILADVVDELTRAGVKAIAFDVILSEPEQPTEMQGVVTDHDAAFAASIKRSGRVLLPASLTFEKPPPESPAVLAAQSELVNDLELTLDQLNHRLLAAGKPSLTPDQYVHSLRKSMAERLRREFEQSPLNPLSADELFHKLLPRQSQLGDNAPVVHIFKQEQTHFLAEKALESFTLPITDPVPALHGYNAIAPLPMFAASARFGGLVDHNPESDGIVRTVPLVEEFHGRLLPQMGLVLACAALNVDPQALQISEHQVTIPLEGGSNITIPISKKATHLGEVGMLMDIPWFGTSHWQSMYGGDMAQHINISSPYELAGWRKRIRANNATLDSSIEYLLSLGNDLGALQRFQSASKNFIADDFAARLPFIRQITSDATLKETINQLNAAVPESLLEQDRTILKGWRTLSSAAENNDLLIKQIGDREAQFQHQLKDRVVLIGITATSSTDLVNTPLAPQVPGVVTHGVILNAILTRQLWTTAPHYITALFTFFCGLLATLAVAFLKHWRAAIGVLLLLIGYLVLNGLVLFDGAHCLVGVAGPVAAMLLVWSAVNLTSRIAENTERARITNRFRNRNDPLLVDYLFENPGQMRLAGQIKDLTVVFTDLAGFTATSERLREKIVDLLNEYFKRMVPLIRNRGGYVNKFLGDGIMFIFGAPYDDPNHANAAVETVLDMIEATKQFSDELVARGLPPINMRAGISSGPMVVGDAGADTASDYTVLGDAVNTGARLEQANKRFDTRILISGGTYRHLSSQFILRPIGSLMLAGKSEGVEAYEVLARAHEATVQDQRLAQLSAAIVTAASAGDATACLACVNEMIAELGVSRFSETYKTLCQRALDEQQTLQKHIIA